MNHDIDFKYKKIIDNLFILLICALLCSTIFFRAAIEHIRYAFLALIFLYFIKEKKIIGNLLSSFHLKLLLLFFLIAAISLLANSKNILFIDEVANWILVFSAGYITSSKLEKHRSKIFVLIPITLFTAFIVTPLILGDGFKYIDLADKNRLQIFFAERANHLGLICGISVFISFYFSVIKNNSSDRLFYGFLTVISFIILIKTGARTAFLATISTCILFIFFNYSRSLKILFVAFFIFTCGAIVLTQADILKNNRIVKLTQGIKSDVSFQQRKLTWAIARDTIKDNLLFGAGFDTFEMQYKKYHELYASKPNFAEKFPYTIKKTNNAHNFSLHFLAETGIFGFFVITFFWFSIISKGITKHTDTTIVVAGTFLISYLAFQLNMSLYGSQLSTLLFSFAGMSSYVIEEL
jgi:O-antigen ligase